MKPCDCKDTIDVRKLSEHGVGHNDESITVAPGVVILIMGHAQIIIPMRRFRQFAEWYLEDQAESAEIADSVQTTTPGGRG